MNTAVILLAAITPLIHHIEAVPVPVREPVAVMDIGCSATNACILTESEIDLVSRLIWLEARGESAECQKAIAEVLHNRLQSGLWGDTIEDVIYAQQNGYWEFEPVPYLYTAEVDEDIREIVAEVFTNGSEISGDILYFRADYYHAWAINEFHIDNTYFSSSPWYQEV